MLFNTDTIAVHTYRALLEDFQALLGPSFGQNASFALSKGIKSMREYEWPTLGDLQNPPEEFRTDVLRFKAVAQMSNWLKKYTFDESLDLYTKVERGQRTTAGFVETQVEMVNAKPNSELAHRVLQHARKICRRILGELSEDEIFDECRIGRRASMGCSFRDSYIDFKLTNPKAFTGTEAASKWFFKQGPKRDRVLMRMVKRLTRNKGFCPSHLTMRHLKAAKVPKSWKIDRLITPLQLLTLFYSYGLGGAVSTRLARHGLDIRRLQEVHKQLILTFSNTRTHATVDLRRASDTLTSWLLACVLPQPWFRAVQKTFCRQIQVDGSMMYTGSVLPMGNGATFPIETLVFYCLIKAVGDLLGVKGGIYSAYGDDLIYPSKVHSCVCTVFKQLGLIINTDKTYVQSYFRESCGADYYRGTDVRPAFLPDGGQKLTKNEYLAFLYKAHNALTKRWEPLLIPTVLKLIKSEILTLQQALYCVPPSFPAYAGLHVDDPYAGFSDEHPFWLPSVRRVYDPKLYLVGAPILGCLEYRFLCLDIRPKRRTVIAEEPYFWLALKGIDDEIVDWQVEMKPRRTAARYAHALVKRNLRGRRSAALEWVRSMGEFPTRSMLDVRVQRRKGERLLIVSVPSKTSFTYSSITGSVSFWI